MVLSGDDMRDLMDDATGDIQKFWFLVATVQRLMTRCNAIKLPMRTILVGLIRHIAFGRKELAANTLQLYKDVGWIARSLSMEELVVFEELLRSEFGQDSVSIGVNPALEAAWMTIITAVFGNRLLFSEQVMGYTSGAFRREVLRLVLANTPLPNIFSTERHKA